MADANPNPLEESPEPANAGLEPSEGDPEAAELSRALAVASLESAEANPEPADTGSESTEASSELAAGVSGEPADVHAEADPERAGAIQAPTEVRRALAFASPEYSEADPEPSETSSESSEAGLEPAAGVSGEPAAANPEAAESSEADPERAEAIRAPTEVRRALAFASPEYSEADPEPSETSSESSEAGSEPVAGASGEPTAANLEGGEAFPEPEDAEDQEPLAVKPRARSFTKGQVMLFEEPYGAVLSPEKINTSCSCCFLLIPPGEPLTPCARCGKVIYCSDQCFAADASFHAVECEVLSNYEDLPSEPYRLGVRVMSRFMTERDRGEESYVSFFEFRRTIHDLQSHMADANEETVELLRSQAQLMKLKMDRAYRVDVSVDELVEILFKIRVNAHKIYESSSATVARIGSGLYLGASKMDHTCQNLDKYILSFNGPNLMLTALEDFTIEKSTDLKRNYIPINQPLQRRRQVLSYKYYFLCDCPRCVTNVDEYERNLPEGLRVFIRSQDCDLWEQRARQFFEVAQYFPPRNYYRYSLAYKLQYLCSQQQKRVLAIRYGLSALEGCMTFEERKQILCLLCQDMAKLGFNHPDHMAHSEFDEVRKQAVDLLSLVFDRSHRLVKELRRLSYRPPRDAAEAVAPRR